MLSRNGRPVLGFSLGAAPTFAQAIADLQNQVGLPIAAGTAYAASDQASMTLDYSDAVSAYQAAGVAGATSVGPEIDAAGAGLHNVTQPLTQQAWALNGQLAALPRSGAIDPSNGVTAPYFTRADATRAGLLAGQMLNLYTQAIAAGAAASGQPVPPGPAPAPAVAAPTPSSVWPIVAIAAAAGVAVLSFMVPHGIFRTA